MNDLKTARKEKGLTQTELAKQSGMTQANINQLEKGDHSAKSGTKKKLEKVLGQIDWIETYKIKVHTKKEAEGILKKFTKCLLGLNDTDKAIMLRKAISQLTNLK